MQNSDVKQRCIQAGLVTIKERYGVDNISQIDGVGAKIAVKREKTLFNKHGVYYPLQVNEYKKKYKKTLAATLLERYGVSNVMDIPGVAEKAARAQMTSGAKESLWLNSINVNEELRQRIVNLSDGGYVVADAFDDRINTVYEFWGDYWHGNPDKYSSTEMNDRVKKTFGELYQLTLEKRNRIINSGFILIEMWENDWDERSIL